MGPSQCVLTVATLTAEAFLEACCPVYTRLAPWRHDLVGVGFGAGEGEESYPDRTSYQWWLLYGATYNDTY